MIRPFLLTQGSSMNRRGAPTGANYADPLLPVCSGPEEQTTGNHFTLYACIQGIQEWLSKAH